MSRKRFWDHVYNEEALCKKALEFVASLEPGQVVSITEYPTSDGWTLNIVVWYRKAQ